MTDKIMRINPFFGCISVLLLLWSSCSRSQVPAFDETRAFGFLNRQVGFGPRNPGSAGHRTCLDFLVQTLKPLADDVVKQPFLFTDPATAKSYTLNNVIASFGKQTDRILLCAHWDTRPVADQDPDPAKRNQPVPGANDGASGTAILLEIAGILRANPPPRGVDIVLFDGEDSGVEGRSETFCAGSRYFAGNKSRSYNPRYAVLVDMVGDRDLRIPVEGFSKQYAPEWVEHVWSKARDLGFTQFDPTVGLEIVDDHLELIRAGIPAVDIIDFDYPFWHTVADTPDKCSPESLKIVGTVLLHLIYD